MVAVALAVTTGEKQASIPFVPLDIKGLKGIKLNGWHNLKLMKTSAYSNRFLSGYWGGPSFTRLCVVITSFVSTDKKIAEKVQDCGAIRIPEHESHCGWFFEPQIGKFSELHWFPLIRMKSLSEYEKVMFQNYHRMSADLLTSIPDEKVMTLFVQFLHT